MEKDLYRYCRYQKTCFPIEFCETTVGIRISIAWSYSIFCINGQVRDSKKLLLIFWTYETSNPFEISATSRLNSYGDCLFLSSEETLLFIHSLVSWLSLMRSDFISWFGNLFFPMILLVTCIPRVWFHCSIILWNQYLPKVCDRNA